MSFSTVEIQTSGRSAWLDAFSVRHRGWLASLDVMSAELGAQPLFTNRPLVGVTEDADPSPRLVITAGRGNDCVTHVVQAATHVWLERTDEGADAALGIDAADGSRAILRFRASAPVETVDGVT